LGTGDFALGHSRRRIAAATALFHRIGISIAESSASVRSSLFGSGTSRIPSRTNSEVNENEEHVDYRTLEQLRKTSPAWRLLVADNAPLVVSFLYKTFIQPNIRTMSQPELASRLADTLYGLREKLGEEAFPKRAAQYLDDWAADSRLAAQILPAQ
jgi:hypothetical protein